MTQPHHPAPGHQRVAIVGAGGEAVRAALLAAGVSEVATLGDAVARSAFDDHDDTWVLTTAGGESHRSAVLIAAPRSVEAPWLPEIPGRASFAGESFPAAATPPGFEPSGKRVAVIGTDAAAAHLIGGLLGAGASVTVFAHFPRRVVAEIPLWSARATAWVRGRVRPGATRPAPAVAASAIDAVIATGIRTVDGREHPFDALVYGTGFAVADHVPDDALVGSGGVTLRRAWPNGLDPFCGVAVRGFPNCFFFSGPDTGAQARYIAECLRLMRRTRSGRIEVRGSSQRVFNERAQLKPAAAPPPASAFDLSGVAPNGNDTFEGSATLRIADTEHPVRVRLTGHLNPVDGQYHWQGTVLASPSQPLSPAILTRARTATLTVGGRSAPARIVEQTPWGTHSVAGVGAPPYAFADR